MSVAELNAAIGAVLSRAFPDEVWVRGEIANLNRPPSGHVYFDLVGDGCALGVTLWAADKQVVNAVLRRAGGAVRMTEGTDVRIRVRVSWYAERGRVSLRMLSLDTAYTLGRLAEGARVAAANLAIGRSPSPSGEPDCAAGSAASGPRHERWQRSRARLPPHPGGKRSRVAGHAARHACAGRDCRALDPSSHRSRLPFHAALRRNMPRTWWRSENRSRGLRPGGGCARDSPRSGRRVDRHRSRDRHHCRRCCRTPKLPDTDRMRDGARGRCHQMVRGAAQHLERHRTRVVAPSEPA